MPTKKIKIDNFYFLKLADKMSSDCETTSTMDETRIVYVKNDVDYSEFALDFLSDEVSYFPYIQSYTTEEDVMLFIRENGIVAKCANIDKDGSLIELETETDYVSIVEWVSTYKGEAAPIDYVLDNVFIGEDLVPLWKVLVDVKDEEDSENQQIVDNQHLCLDMFQRYMLLGIMGLYIVIGITLLTIISFAH